ncbi:beta-galactosidase-1-like protein 2 isoform X2 [Nematostella vectensis]|uniref:beta-galactosidase-1-like protein 2 isoform X2 n=1 Tax=Nematostella vectensis TaxID=45351 RepID=UPI00138FCFE4|nr:beta-galactosidase-1-like protein 2 isoform X2 [Nematostella vectensis]
MMALNRMFTAMYSSFRRRPCFSLVLILLCLGYLFYMIAFSSLAMKRADRTRNATLKTFQAVPTRRGLEFSNSKFILNGKPFVILSGALHYFRVMPEYWADRLKKLKAMGLNTVETYVAWNLHEQVKENFKFKDEVDIVKFVNLAQELGLHVIIRPGPYICSEWDLGGLPSWLLNDPNMRLRSTYGPFMEAVEKYFSKLFALLTPLQFSGGGPIIAWQVENEYASVQEEVDNHYMELLHKLMLKNGATELLFTSDDVGYTKRYPIKLDGVLKTINFQHSARNSLTQLQEFQPDKPIMVTEYWSGWFDHWGEKHHVLNTERKMINEVKDILDMGASINFYMFHGGTNFGFMNGANTAGNRIDDGYQPDVTSYDYDAPLSEAGDITPKYKALRKLIQEHVPGEFLPDPLPDIPPNLQKAAYDNIHMKDFVPLQKIYKYIDQAIDIAAVTPMEFLPINNNGGQGYGFTIYQTTLKHHAKSLTIEKIRDRAHVILNSKLISTLCGYDEHKRHFNMGKLDKNEVELKFEKPKDSDDDVFLEIMVENMGRVNFGKGLHSQRKGILGQVLIDGHTQNKWKVYPLDFHKTFTERAFLEVSWSKPTEGASFSPGFYRGILHIQGQPRDSFVHPKGWGKGVCLVNGKNLGRYWKLGPQEALYLPASWLRSGDNTIILFEVDGAKDDGILEFSDSPMLGNDIQEQ